MFIIIYVNERLLFGVNINSQIDNVIQNLQNTL